MLAALAALLAPVAGATAAPARDLGAATASTPAHRPVEIGPVTDDDDFIAHPV